MSLNEQLDALRRSLVESQVNLFNMRHELEAERSDVSEQDKQELLANAHVLAQEVARLTGRLAHRLLE